MKTRLLYIILFLATAISSTAQLTGTSWWNTDYNTTEGTEFWVTFMRNSGASVNDSGKKLTCYLYITSRENANVSVTNPNTGWNESISIIPNELKVIKVPLEQAYIELDFVAQNCGIHIQSDKNISVYSTNHHESGKYDGTNILPMNSLMNSYVIQTYLYDESAAEFAIIATEDNQPIEIQVTQTNLNKDSFELGILDTISVFKKDITLNNLKRGQTYLYRTDSTIYSTLSGSKICSESPIAVFQGGQNVRIPQGSDNHIFHQVSPNDQWGKTFVVTPTFEAIYDYVRITAAEDNTLIFRDGILKTKLNALETFQDTIKSKRFSTDFIKYTYIPTITTYTTNKAASCYLYATNKDINGPTLIINGNEQQLSHSYGSPVMTPITPQEHALDSVVFVTLNNLTHDMNHYVNIVTHTSEVSGMRLDGNDISNDFQIVPSNPQYSYAIKRLKYNTSNYRGVHRIENTNKNVTSTFTARVYGLGSSIKGPESYAYSAGSRVARSADMLINDKYVREVDICIDDEAKFTPIINYDFYNYYWKFIGPNKETITTPTNTIEQDHYQTFPSSDDWEVNLVIERHNPLCENVPPIIDTIKGVIHVHDTIHYVRGHSDTKDENLCIGEEFYVHYNKGTRYDYIADTVTPQEIHGETTTFKLDSTYIFRDTLATGWGCDSIIVQRIHIRPHYDTLLYDTTCVNKLPYQWKDRSGNVIKSLDLTEKDKKELILTTENKYQEKTINDTTSFNTIYDCDSIVRIQLTVLPIYNLVDSAIECIDPDIAYNWKEHTDKGHKIYSNGKVVPYIPRDKEGVYTYIDSLKTKGCTKCELASHGCDSVWTLKLTVLPGIVERSGSSICTNDSIIWQDTAWVGRDFPISTIPIDQIYRVVYQDTTLQVEYQTNEYGCDSTIIHTLNFYPNYSTDIVDTICENELPYIWRPNELPTRDTLPIVINVENPIDKPTILHDTIILKSVDDCDMTVTFNLTVTPTFKDPTIYDTICESALPYNYTDTRAKRLLNLNKSGIYIDTIPTHIYGCDSIITLNLTINPTTVKHEKVTWCQSAGPYSFDNKELTKLQNLTTSGTYRDTLKTEWNTFGCDSVVEIELTVLDSIVTYIHEDICDNELPYNHPNILAKNLLNLSQTGIYRDTLVSINGCDSVLVLDLQVHPTYKTTDTVRICDNENPYIWITNDTYGTYVDTVYFTPNEQYIDPVTGIAKKDLIHITDKQRMLTSIYGCDSLVHLHLVVLPTYFFLTDTTICSNEFIEFQGQRFNKDTIFTYPERTNFGCDSIYQLHLHIIPSYLFEKRIDICDNEIAYHRTPTGDEIVWEPGDDKPKKDEFIYLRYQTLEGCDSVYQYSVRVHDTYDSVANATICSNESYQVHDGLLFTPSIAYHEPGSNPAVIDTLITDKLKTVTCEECKGKGCDSIFRANIRILPAYKHTDSVTICSNEIYQWRGRDIHEPLAKTYYYADSLLTVNTQCDSIYELVLTVHQAYDTMLPPVTICADEYYQIGDSLYNESGIYSITLQSKHGCDSIVNTELIVLDTTNLFIKDTICVTEKYILDTLYSNYRIFTEQGFYKDTSINEWGCKHFTYLDLTIIDTTKYTIEIGDICADEDEILVYYQYEGHPLIEYSVIFDSLGISQGFNNIHHAPLDSNLSFFSIPIPKGEMLPHPEPTYFDSQQGVNDYTYEDKFAYPQPNKYSMTVIMHNGICGDTLQRKDTTMNIKYPSWIHEQHWNDAVVLYKDTFNGGYKFSHYQWYQNGEPIIGATKEYLYLPNRLLMNRPGECDNYYQVMLTREEDGYSALTCPICPIEIEDTIVPRLDYYSIVPTSVPSTNPVVHILSTLPGTYKVYLTEDGIVPNIEKPEGNFEPNIYNYAGEISLKGCPSGVVIIKLFLDNNGIVEQRTTKVIIH